MRGVLLRTGVSLGGMHAWLLAVADTRVAACAPMIGIQVGVHEACMQSLVAMLGPASSSLHCI